MSELKILAATILVDVEKALALEELQGAERELCEEIRAATLKYLGAS